MAGNRFKLALIQLAVGANKAANVKRAVELIGEAANAGSKMVVLPECFCLPYGNQYFGEYAETVPGPTTEALSAAARLHSVVLVGGSIAERAADGKLYNTCSVFNSAGDTVATHRKVHLFDIDVPGKIKFVESATLTAGDKLTTFDTDWCKVGLGICYDIRFAEMARVYTNRGAEMLVYPGAFNMTTGPAHWQLIARARAIDNQLYSVVCSPARDTAASYVAWGHSTVVNPWGEVIAQADEKETIVYADIDLEKLREIRQMIPLRNQLRSDLYATIEK